MILRQIHCFTWIRPNLFEEISAYGFQLGLHVSLLLIKALYEDEGENSGMSFTSISSFTERFVFTEDSEADRWIWIFDRCQGISLPMWETKEESTRNITPLVHRLQSRK